jgi:phosphatidylserine/phosphatidylglycerophosphate/cardiolipin synthase-like enzyme
MRQARLARLTLFWASAFLLLAQAELSRADQSASPSIVNTPAKSTVQAAFSPWDDVEGLILDAIGQARHRILVQAYLLTSRKITHTLIAAHRRGVAVQVLVDGGQLVKTESPPMMEELVDAGIPVWMETRYQHAHNKVIVIDSDSEEAVLITGSYNFTWAAQNRNAENVLIVRHDPALAARYAMNWERHRQDASAYRK